LPEIPFRTTLFGLRRQSEAATALFPTWCDPPVRQVTRDACEPEESNWLLFLGVRFYLNIFLVLETKYTNIVSRGE
jgi:hypothetical protein